MATPLLMLWDIDHTLIATRGAGQQLYQATFAAVFGRSPVRIADMAGRTERAIITDTLALNGIDGVDSLDAFYAALGSAAHEMREQLREQGTALPGAPEALDALAADGVVQSVVTGNIRSVADAKLSAFDLLGHLDLGIGGFGDEHIDRAVLVRLAIERAEAKYGLGFTAAGTVVVGDTPHDVKGALDVGAVAVGVATGSSDVGVLAAAGADLVLADLRDISGLLDLVALRCRGGG